MSRPIKISAEMIDSMQKEFVNTLLQMKLADGKVSYTKKLTLEDDARATVEFSAEAFAKMILLVQNFTSEVAWHGVAKRDEHDPSYFRITDIMVYPQEVTGSTVNTDQEAYQTWLYQFDDDVFNNIRMQGHSHVNFSTSPSGVDLTHQEKILAQVGDNDFYIFMIWNQKFERTIKIFDMANNTLYETGDVDVLIGEAGCDLAAFVRDAKEVVKTKTYQYGNYGNSYTYNKKDEPKTPAPTTPRPKAPGTTTTTKSKHKNGAKDKQKPAAGEKFKYDRYPYYDEYDDYGHYDRCY